MAKARRLRLPANQWRPRPYQMDAWSYLQGGGKRASLWWHRRSGKDELCLHWTCLASQQRVGNYWHMLPESSQARKALWHAVNPITGRRRIDDVFPPEIRANILDNEMLIQFKNGSTWQVIGSNNYMALVGTPPVGIVFSEWAKANPQAHAYLSPILAENDGWAIYPTTPMGKNHAYRTHGNFQSDPDAFAQTLTVDDTGVYHPKLLERERKSLVEIYGDTLGAALFDQEYYCSAEAAVLGAVYAGEIAQIKAQGRLGDVPVANAPVYTAWDLGRTDATAIWWFQVVGGEVRIIDYYEATLEDVSHYAEQIKGRKIINEMADWAYSSHGVVWGYAIDKIAHRQNYDYAMHYLPHDAAHKLLASKGVSIEQMLRKALGNVQIVDTQSLPMSSQIAACRSVLRRSWFDVRVEQGLETLSMYRYAYDEARRILSDKPIHDWTSHCADAWRILSLAASDQLMRTPAKPLVSSKLRRAAHSSRRGSAWAN